MVATAIIAALAIALATVHVVGSELRSLRVLPRSWWLSVGSGVSVAYVFVHLLPEITERQSRVTEAAEFTRFGGVSTREHLLFVAVLLGFATYYGLELLVRRSQRKRDEHDEVQGAETRTSAGIFWIHVGSFAAYNLLVGYLLVQKADLPLSTVLLFAVAIGLHFLVNDFGLREHHRDAYEAVGRWILAASVLAGFVAGFVYHVNDLALSVLFGFLAGGIVLNVIKEELPEERQSRFGAFLAGTLGYTVLLLAL